MGSRGYNGNNGNGDGRWAHQNQLEQDFGNGAYGQHGDQYGYQTHGNQESNIDPELLRQNGPSPISPVPNIQFGHTNSTGLSYPQPSAGIDVAGGQSWVPESYHIDPAAAPAIDNWFDLNFGSTDFGTFGDLPIQQSAPISAAPMRSQYTTPYNAAPFAAPTAEMAGPSNPYPAMNGTAPFPLDSAPARPSSTRPNKRRRQATTRQASYQALQNQIICPGFFDHEENKMKICAKVVKKSNDPDGIRCTKCYAKLPRVNAKPKEYKVDPTINLQQAWDTLYPQMEGLDHPQDDVATESLKELEYIQRLARAVSTPYVSDNTPNKANAQRLRQQVKVNRKPFDSFQYDTHLVIKRLLLLFHTAVSYHAGGQSFYDIGGDNYGYGEDKDLIFSQRMHDIIQMLTTDKDIAMDVIEGRGVTALVKNPDKYQRRKRDNKKSNDTKADLQEKGKQVLEAEQRMSTAPAEGHVEQGGVWQGGEVQQSAEVFDFDGYVPAG